jgi:hypothetical protein
VLAVRLRCDEDGAPVGVAWYRRLPSPFAPDLPVAQHLCA